jgi:hypothetical protein
MLIEPGELGLKRLQVVQQTSNRSQYNCESLLVIDVLIWVALTGSSTVSKHEYFIPGRTDFATHLIHIIN